MRPAWSTEASNDMPVSDESVAAGESVRRTNGELRPPFDLSSIPSSRNGVLAVRPAVILNHPEMEPLVKAIDDAIQKKLAEHDTDSNLTFSVKNLVQAVGPVTVETIDTDAPEGSRGRLTMSLSAIRSATPLPFEELLTSTLPETTVVKNDAGTVIQTPQLHPMFGQLRSFAMPDAKTILPGGDQETLQAVAGPQSVQTNAPWYDVWRKVEPASIVLLFDNSSSAWNWPLESSRFPDVAAACKHSHCLAVGYDWSNHELTVQIVVGCDQLENVPQVVSGVKSVVRQLLEEAAGSHDTPDEFLGEMYTGLLNRLAAAEATVEGKTATLSATVPVESNPFSGYVTLWVSQLVNNMLPVEVAGQPTVKQ